MPIPGGVFAAPCSLEFHAGTAGAQSRVGRRRTSTWCASRMLSERRSFVTKTSINRQHSSYLESALPELNPDSPFRGCLNLDDLGVVSTPDFCTARGRLRWLFAVSSEGYSAEMRGRGDVEDGHSTESQAPAPGSHDRQSTGPLPRRRTAKRAKGLVTKDAGSSRAAGRPDFVEKIEQFSAGVVEPARRAGSLTASEHAALNDLIEAIAALLRGNV